MCWHAGSERVMGLFWSVSGLESTLRQGSSLGYGWDITTSLKYKCCWIKYDSLDSDGFFYFFYFFFFHWNKKTPCFLLWRGSLQKQWCSPYFDRCCRGKTSHPTEKCHEEALLFLSPSICPWQLSWVDGHREQMLANLPQETEFPYPCWMCSILWMYAKLLNHISMPHVSIIQWSVSILPHINTGFSHAAITGVWAISPDTFSTTSFFWYCCSHGKQGPGADKGQWSLSTRSTFWKARDCPL